MNVNKGYDQLNMLKTLQNEISIENKQELKDTIVSSIYLHAEEIANEVVTEDNSKKIDWDEKLDNILTSKYIGFPIMFLLLGLVFWLTIIGSNFPSEMLSDLFVWGEGHLTNFFVFTNSPEWLHGVLVLASFSLWNNPLDYKKRMWE